MCLKVNVRLKTRTFGISLSVTRGGGAVPPQKGTVPHLNNTENTRVPCVWSGKLDPLAGLRLL